MRLLPIGPDAVLVEVDTTEHAMALYAVARATAIRASDIVPGARSVLFDGVSAMDVQDLVDRVAGADVREPLRSSPAEVIEIPTTYDGPDLADTAELLGLTVDRLMTLHTSTLFTVAFCGFSPGFAYCVGWDRTVPRLPTPRTRVDPGSVGLAGEFTGVYPSASPGGWRLIGRTDVELWDPAQARPALLGPGTRLRFVPT